MDYIREELLRQQAALTALLLGSAGEDTADSTPKIEKGASLKTPEIWKYTQAWLKQATGAGAKTELSAAQAWAGELPQSADSPSQYNTGEAGPAAEMVQRYWAFGGEEEQPLGETAPQSLGKPLARQTMEFLWSPEERKSSGVRDISLALERDARRYDGGFSLY